MVPGHLPVGGRHRDAATASLRLWSMQVGSWGLAPAMGDPARHATAARRLTQPARQFAPAYGDVVGRDGKPAQGLGRSARSRSRHGCPRAGRRSGRDAGTAAPYWNTERTRIGRKGGAPGVARRGGCAVAGCGQRTRARVAAVTSTDLRPGQGSDEGGAGEPASAPHRDATAHGAGARTDGDRAPGAPRSWAAPGCIVRILQP